MANGPNLTWNNYVAGVREAPVDPRRQLIARELHAKNPNRNPEGGRSLAEFDLELLTLSASSTYRLVITSKIVVDFDYHSKILAPTTVKRKYRAMWIRKLKNLVENKWNVFRLVDRRSSAFFVEMTIICELQTPQTKTSDYHIWVRIHPKFSFALSIQPSGYRGTVWYLKPNDIDPDGNAAHEFGHMIGVTHVNMLKGARLMYGNDRIARSEVAPMIKNAIGYVYPEIDLDFHRRWVMDNLQEKGLLEKSKNLYFEPSRNL